MKHYSNEELDAKIHVFLNRKFEQYPEIGARKVDRRALSRPHMKSRLMQSLTSHTAIWAN